MKIVARDGLSVGFLVTKHRPPQRSASFFVKGTFRIRADEVAAPAEESEFVCGDVHFADDPGRSLRYASDFAPLKPRADVLVVGTGYAPGGEPVTSFQVGFRVGRFSKTLQITGDRIWRQDLSSEMRTAEPKPLVSLPIAYEYAFGGRGYMRNPVGRGWSESAAPNIEDPKRRLQGLEDRADPAGFGPLSAAWEPRKSLTGTYDLEWLKERWPWFPADFDWSYFNAAPRDQQIDGYLRGDEALEFENLHPLHAVYRTRLPGLRTRCFLNERLRGGEWGFREVPLKLDTLWIDMAAEIVVLVWRGITDVRTMKLKEIEHLFVVTESLQDPSRSVDECRALLDQRLAENDDAKEESASPTAVTSEDELDDSERELAEMDQEIRQAEAEAAKSEADAREQLIAAGVDPKLLQANTASTGLAGAREAVIAAIAQLKEKSPEYATQMPELQAQLAEIEELEKMDQEMERVEDEEGSPTRQSVELAAARGESFAGKRLDGLDLSGLNLAGVDFQRAFLLGSNLRGANLSRANLSRAAMGDVDLSGADLTGAVLDRADLAGSLLTEAKLTGLSLAGATLSELKLLGADFSGCTGRGVDFSGSDLTGARFTGASLPQADFSESKLERSDFRGTQLQAAQFGGVMAQAINMEGADITGLQASDQSDFTGGNFKRVKGAGSIWEESVLDGADFSRAQLTGALFPDASLRGTLFDRAELANSVFDDACLEGAVLTNANLLRASFDRADLTEADVRGANLYEAGFCEVVIARTDFLGANLKGTRLG